MHVCPNTHTKNIYKNWHQRLEGLIYPFVSIPEMGQAINIVNTHAGPSLLELSVQGALTYTVHNYWCLHFSNFTWPFRTTCQFFRKPHVSLWVGGCKWTSDYLRVFQRQENKKCTQLWQIWGSLT